MDPKIRNRVSYLFSRFTKDLRSNFSPYVEKILQCVQDLLTFWNPLDELGSTSSASSSTTATASGGGGPSTPPSAASAASTAALLAKHEQQRQFYDDQQFLYETVSLLIVNSSLDAKIKVSAAH